MPFPRQEPQEGTELAQTWTFLKTIPKGGINGHLAGQTEWVECHHQYRSIPCYWILSKGKLECPWCKITPRIDWMGYVPIYSEIGAPVVAGVRKGMRDLLKRIDFYTAVKVVKGDTKFGKVAVLPNRNAPPYVPSREQAANPVDLRDWLLVLWKEPVLSQWVRSQSDTPVSLPPPPVREAPEVTDPMVRAAWEKACREQEARKAALPTVGDLVPAVLPASNGKHKARK